MLTVRIDRPAWPLEDFHTVGGLPPDTTGPTVEGRRPAGEATITSPRDLADAAFTLAPEGSEGLSTKAAQPLRVPVWPSWLGCRAGVPIEPLPSAANLHDAAELLPTSVRLTRRRPPHGEGAVSVDIADEQQQASLHAAGAPPAPPAQLIDVPVSFAPTRRHPTTRGVWGAVGQRPAALRVRDGATQQAALRDRHHPGAPAWPSG